MMNAWTPMTSARPAASSARKSSAADAADPQPALDDDEVQPRIARIPTRPSSSPSAANGKSVWIGRDRRPAADARQPRAEPDRRAGRPARRRGAPGRPGSPRRAGRRTGRARCRRASGRGRTSWYITSAAERRTGSARGRRRLTRPVGDVQEQQEDREEQQRRAEVALDDDDRRGRSPTSRPSGRGTAAAAGGAVRPACPARPAARRFSDR